MRHPSIDKLLNKVGSKYLLVNVVAKRAKEIENNGFDQTIEKIAYTWFNKNTDFR